MAPDGKPLQAENGKTDPDACWRGTLFDAALDGADHKPWHRDCPGGTDRWWPNQGRLVCRAHVLLGLDQTITSRLAQEIAAALCVPPMLLRECRRAFHEAPGYHSRGKAVRDVLRAMPRGRARLDRLLAAGHLAGLWGRPYRWRRRTAVLQSLAFRPAGSGIPPPRGRAGKIQRNRDIVPRRAPG